MDTSASTAAFGLQGKQGLIRSASVDISMPKAAQVLAERLGRDDLDCVLLFAAPQPEVAAIAGEVGDLFRPARVVGCTTFGEIDGTGYATGKLLGLGLPRSHFRTSAMTLTESEAMSTSALVRKTLSARARLTREAPDWPHEFAILLIDGSTMREDAIMSRVASALGPVPLVGASVGCPENRQGPVIFGSDGAGFRATLLQVRSRCPIRTFRSDHFHPTNRRMVITRADPELRLALEINGVPAAAEYARLLRLDPTRLSDRDFAANPLVVRVGADHHVRAIRGVTADGALQFHSAMGEGMVLTVAAGEEMVMHLERELTTLSLPTPPEMILCFDSYLRRLEAERGNRLIALSRILTRRRVRGFSTLGEQQGGMHVNNTMTGIAFYAPGSVRIGR
ncbi:FIST signal transduction protein [Oceanicola sp. S124]|uniref:FIST signal transduction protein n=1 Tax=Oceanicola sp. S124 TaxID=1042378 RepID=UPI00025588F8|nr:FIST N-terminal domain-containing protein [Oceanicola sp. S124]